MLMLLWVHWMSAGRLSPKVTGLAMAAAVAGVLTIIGANPRELRVFLPSLTVGLLAAMVHSRGAYLYGTDRQSLAAVTYVSSEPAVRPIQRTEAPPGIGSTLNEPDASAWQRR